MNKSEMARKVAAQSGLTQSKAAEVLEIVFDPVFGVVADDQIA